MAEYQSLSKRFEKYKASKSVIFWACAGTAVATMVVGFVWGGWVTGKTAREMAAESATAARAELAAAFCVNQFAKGPDAAVQLASLTKQDSWERGSFVEKGGWTTLPGTKAAVEGAAGICAAELINPKSATRADASTH
jgi:hypothetical protein